MFTHDIATYARRPQISNKFESAKMPIPVAENPANLPMEEDGTSLCSFWEVESDGERADTFRPGLPGQRGGSRSKSCECGIEVVVARNRIYGGWTYRYLQTMSKKRSKDDADGTDLPKEEWCYVVTYEEWNHGLPTETAHAVVGVFKTKEAAAAAVGGYEGTGWGAMDSVTEEDREEFGSTDNRDNPPENGLLFSLFADGTGEGDFIRFHIEKLPLLD